MNIGDNLSFLETHYIKVWLKKWQQQLETAQTEEEREQLQNNIDKAEAEIASREA